MSLVTMQYKCDGCGAVKGDVNHWWVGWVESDGQISIAPWDSEEAAIIDRKHFHGAECVHKFVSEAMTKKAD